MGKRPFHASVYDWYHTFSTGCTDISNIPHAYVQSTAVCNVNSYHVEELIWRSRLNAVHDIVYSRRLNAKSVDCLTQHTEELKTFISIHNIDVMLISEMHFTEKKPSKTFQLYSLYHMNHPTGTA
jgi:hypothetical protein